MSRLAELLASGELHRVARTVKTQRELAGKLGMTSDAFVNAKARLAKRGIAVPDLVTLQSADAVPPAERWPNLAAFDADDAPQPIVPERHFVRAVSTLVDPDGNIKQQWIKTGLEQGDALELLAKACERIAAGWDSVPQATEPPPPAPDDLLCVLPWGDPHIGMLAWERETGENFDLAIAERNLIAAVDHLVSLSPQARRCLLMTVGDTFHYDGLLNQTTRGTRVDADGRMLKMVETGVRIFRRAIDQCLRLFEIVDVKIARGNHDHLLALLLSMVLRAYYANEPRVHVDPSPEEFHWYRFGANLLGVTHGDKAKAMELMGVMAVDCAKEWGETKYRRIYAGHVHHEVTKEVPGVTIDHLNTLAAQDDWHRRMGYRATRHMRMDIYHREYGFINRHIVGVQQLLGRAA